MSPTTTLILGLILMAVIGPLALKRVVFLARLITNGQPAPDRIENVTKRTVRAIFSQLTEVLGQQRLLKWTVPGIAHAFVMYAFLILVTVYLEAFGILFSRNPKWAIPVVGRWDVLGFSQDLIGVLCLVGLLIFTIIRFRNDPDRLGRKSRFKGSHLGGAWLTLFMIFNVIWTMFFFRGAAAAADNLPYGNGAFASQAVGRLLEGASHNTLEIMEGVGLLLHIGVMLVFSLLVLHSKHLHIFVAPLNVMFKRPDGPLSLGAVKPMQVDGKTVTMENVEEFGDDVTLGIGRAEDFTWKGMLDFASCTECGRCQSQCPAWNTEKPLSPKMLIMNLRDHAWNKAPYMLASESKKDSVSAAVMTEVERPLVGETEGIAWEPDGGAVIDHDVLWSCTNCGACVNQCPVDIEHVDHITDMRRYQVLVESNFPAELNGLFRGLEGKGNPWNMNPNARMEWASGLDFDVKVVGEDVQDLDEVEWLFWVGCAGAYEDRAKKTTRAVAELLNMAGVDFAVLGNGETCTGDPARRAGNEFVFQGLAQQNTEVLTQAKAKKVVSTCPHCFNTLRNEYKEFGIELEVVHHTQLLNRLVREKKLVPVAAPESNGSRTLTFHDPCFLGRHNQVYTPPRELLDIIPDAELVEMDRSAERSFCCGAGGARMWMEETIGERINTNRTREAVGTGADQIAVGCPFCRVMLHDGLVEEQAEGRAAEEVQVMDVAQLLLASVKGENVGAAPAEAKAAAAEKAAADAEAAEAARLVREAEAAAAAAAAKEEAARRAAEEAAKEAEARAAALSEAEQAAPAGKATSGSLFDDAPASDAPAGDAPAKPSTGGSLFDDAPASGGSGGSGGSLFDTPADKPADKPAQSAPASGGSLFDVAPTEAPSEPAAEPKAEVATSEPEAPASATPATEIGSGSLFDIPAGESASAPVSAPEPPADEVAASEAAADAEEAAEEAAADEGADDAQDEATQDEAAADEPAEQGQKPSHQPRTDANINESGSLFDL